MGRVKILSSISSSVSASNNDVGSDQTSPLATWMHPSLTESSDPRYRNNEDNLRRLNSHIIGMRKTVYSEPLDLACASYVKVKDDCAALVKALLTNPPSDNAVPGQQMTPVSPVASPKVGSVPAEDPSQAYRSAVNKWKECIEGLASKLHDRLESNGLLGAAESTAKAQPSRTDLRMSSERLQRYEQLKKDLGDLEKLLQPPLANKHNKLMVYEYVIARRGDTLLQFENLAVDGAPILRYRVSSHMLRETSPIFARMFSTPLEELEVENLDMQEDVSSEMPLSSKKTTAPDGSAAMLFNMPQFELDEQGSLELLLHAAHMHHDKIPRSISFEQLVDLAETCLRYRCTAPVEFPFEHLWLPQWIHRAASDQEGGRVVPDGMLLVSYAFGLRRLFTCTSKSAVLFLRGDEDIEAHKNWPPELKQRLTAMCETKRAQIYEACAAAVQGYLPAPPSAQSGTPSTAQAQSNGAAPAATEAPSSTKRHPIAPDSMVSITADNTTRCPSGLAECDALNLGWLTIGLTQRHLLPHTSFPPYTPSSSRTSSSPTASAQSHPPGRSLAALIDDLRGLPSPPQQHHAGCDPAGELRSFANDVYNSVAGLTLFQASGGRAHGWALSRNKRDEPQAVLSVSVGKDGRGLGANGGDGVALAAEAREGPVDEEVVGGMSAMTLAEAIGPERVVENGDVGEVTKMMQSATLGELARDLPSPAPVLRVKGVMTKEEAYEILWPGGAEPAQEPPAAGKPEGTTAEAGAREGNREKFRADDALFVAEAKTLVAMDGKQLRGERDKMVGLLPAGSPE